MMRLRPLLLWLALLACALLAPSAPAGLLPRLGEALRASFPGQAARVLAAPRGFAEAEGGWRAEGDPGAVLPRHGEGVLRFAIGPGIEVRVREVGAKGRAAGAERAMAYARAGGASFWAAEAEGLEEWLMLDPGAVRRDAPVAAWEVEGAAVRQRGEAVEIVDEQEEARLVVTAPEAFAAGGRPVAARLAARGERVELWVDAEGEAVLVDPAWKRTRSMLVAREGHTATVLGDGTVLVAGGDSGGTAELYDPTARTWTATPPMTTPRSYHTATLLNDGSVLVAGGDGNGTAELYDPKLGTWTATGSMTTPRSYHTATLLDDGSVLVTGGQGEQGTQDTAEVYDSSAGTWTKVASMSVPRSFHAAAKLGDGRVLVMGGFFYTSEATQELVTLNLAEVYDPTTKAWTPVASMVSARYGHTATLLQDGNVLVAGGRDLNGERMSTAEVYDPDANVLGIDAWLDVGAMITPRALHTATLLDDGRVLVAGGNDAASTSEIYDPKTTLYPPDDPAGIWTGTWTPVLSMSAARVRNTAALLADGRVLVAGGLAGGAAVATAEEFEIQSGLWTPVASMSAERTNHTATSLPGDGVLVAGGVGVAGAASVVLASAEKYDDGTGAWSPAGSMSTPRAYHTATQLADDRVLVAGGTSASGYGGQFWATAEVYDPEANGWKTTGSMSTPRASHTATLLGNGKVLVAGGLDPIAPDTVPVATAELYDPSTGAWQPAASMGTARFNHTATLLLDGTVLVAGGETLDLASIAGAEVYDPVANTWTPAGSMSTARANHTATLLPDGSVLVTGGANGAYGLASAETYDPNAAAWTPSGSMSTPRVYHTATALQSGVLIAGGQSGSTGVEPGGVQETAEVLDPTTGAWTPVALMKQPRAHHTATPLSGGRVVVAGGETYDTNGDAVTLNSVEVFEPQALGEPCSLPLQCQSGFCVDGVCCNETCDVDCRVCSVAIGADEDGTCKLPESTCGDGTQSCVCNGYACDKQGATPMCASKCVNSDGCDAAYVCSNGACILPVSTWPDDCALSPAPPAPPSRRPLEPALFLLAAAAAVRRRS